MKIGTQAGDIHPAAELLCILETLTVETDTVENVRRPVDALISANINLNTIQNDQGEGLAHICARRGLNHILLSLIGQSRWNKTDLDLSSAEPKNQATPLHLACQQGHLSVVRTLLIFDRSAITLSDSSGKTPADYITEREDKALYQEAFKSYGTRPVLNAFRYSNGCSFTSTASAATGRDVLMTSSSGHRPW